MPYSDTFNIINRRHDAYRIFYFNEVHTMNNHIGLFIKLHKEHDKKIIERLNEQPNKQGYIKDLILKDYYIKEQYKK